MQRTDGRTGYRLGHQVNVALTEAEERGETLHGLEVLTRRTKLSEVASDAVMKRSKWPLGRHDWQRNAFGEAGEHTRLPLYAILQDHKSGNLMLGWRVSGDVKSRDCDQEELVGLVEGPQVGDGLPYRWGRRVKRDGAP